MTGTAVLKGRRFAHPSERLLYGLIGLAAVLGVWQLAASTGAIRTSLFGSPEAIVRFGIQDLASGKMWPHLLVSLQEFVIGWAAAIAIGIPVGFLIGLYRRLSYLVEPFVAAMYATPTVALAPIIVIAMGLGLQSRSFIVFLLSVVVTIYTTSSGIRSVDPRNIQVARSFGASRWLEFRAVLIPASIPYVLTGLRVGAGQAVRAVVVAEFIAANVGLGYYIQTSGYSLQASRVMFGILILGGFGIALVEVLNRLGRRFDRWRPAIR